MIRTVNASFYTDSLVVEGFPTKGEYDVELYSVSYGEAVSTPLVVKSKSGYSSLSESAWNINFS